jgi:hypothetical protein
MQPQIAQNPVQSRCTTPVVLKNKPILRGMPVQGAETGQFQAQAVRTVDNRVVSQAGLGEDGVGGLIGSSCARKQ